MARKKLSSAAPGPGTPVGAARAGTKYTIVFNERQEDRLSRLANQLGVSKADIVRQAVGLLDVIVREATEPGKSLEVVGRDGQRTKLVVDLL